MTSHGLEHNGVNDYHSQRHLKPVPAIKKVKSCEQSQKEGYNEGVNGILAFLPMLSSGSPFPVLGSFVLNMVSRRSFLVVG